MLTSHDVALLSQIRDVRTGRLAGKTDGPRRCANTVIQGPDRSSILEEVIG